MYKLSNSFHHNFRQKNFGQKNFHQISILENITQQTQYRQMLLHNLLLQTSCFRYWGQGTWTDYAQEIYRQGDQLMNSKF